MAYSHKNTNASRISLHKSSKVVITFPHTCSMSENGDSTGNDVLSTSEDFHHDDTPTSTAEPGSSAPSPPQSSSPMPKIEVGPEYVMQADATSSCVTQTIVAGIGGLGLGSLAGLAFGSVEGVETGAQHASARATATAAAREAGSRAWSYAKGFGGVGALYSGSQCVFESSRAKHDIYNHALAGCFSGGVLAARQGPFAAAGGCVTFALFSTAIEHFMHG